MGGNELKGASFFKYRDYIGAWSRSRANGGLEMPAAVRSATRRDGHGAGLRGRARLPES